MLSMNLIKQTIIACAFAFATSNNASAAILDIATDGTLMGASGVDVGSVLYDVTFGDGIMDNSLSPFTTSEQATLASEALLSQVLLDDYDTLSKNTNGCTIALCFIFTSYGRNGDIVLFSRVTNVQAISNLGSPSNPRLDYTSLSSLGKTATTSGTTGAVTTRTIAFWTARASVTAVPEPETYAMFLAGLGLLGFASRRKKA